MKSCGRRGESDKKGEDANTGAIYAAAQQRKRGGGKRKKASPGEGLESLQTSREMGRENDTRIRKIRFTSPTNAEVGASKESRR